MPLLRWQCGWHRHRQHCPAIPPPPPPPPPTIVQSSLRGTEVTHVHDSQLTNSTANKKVTFQGSNPIQSEPPTCESKPSSDAYPLLLNPSQCKNRKHQNYYIPSPHNKISPIKNVKHAFLQYSMVPAQGYLQQVSCVQHGRSPEGDNDLTPNHSPAPICMHRNALNRGAATRVGNDTAKQLGAMAKW